VMKFSYKNCLHVHIKQNLEHLLENGWELARGNETSCHL
jgi:hypothetical protein